MVWASSHTVILDGLAGHIIDVQADLGNGVIATTFVGRPDTSVSEARDRCRTAIVNSGFSWPTTKRVTVLLSPADLPKRGPHLDLAIALAVLAAQQDRLVPSVGSTLVIGELSLDGRVRAVPGVLPMVMAARSKGWERVMVPDIHAEEASLVDGVRIVGIRSLGQAVAWFAGEPLPDAPPVEPLTGARVLTWRGEGRADDLDLADVHGMAESRFAIEVAAAGGHHLMLVGPKGAGKTTLAERLPGLLPDLGVAQSLELAAVRSLAGEPPTGRSAGSLRPPFRAPHHSASRASLLGGGSGRVHPGELSKALHGVLFLDEFPLFATDLIDALRQPLEHGEVTIARGDEVATFPARSIVALACNPCPCGDYHADVRLSRCTCSEVSRRRYRERIRGPILDRIDIVQHLSPIQPWERYDELSPPESSAVVRARVSRARDRAAARLEGTPWLVNADVPGPRLEKQWPCDAAGAALIHDALVAGRISRRGVTRVHRLAWTVADLAHVDRPGFEEVTTALCLRVGDPLSERALSRRSA